MLEDSIQSSGPNMAAYLSLLYVHRIIDDPKAVSPVVVLCISLIDSATAYQGLFLLSNCMQVLKAVERTHE
jgi:hypothetical protein